MGVSTEQYFEKCIYFLRVKVIMIEQHVLVNENSEV